MNEIIEMNNFDLKWGGQQREANSVCPTEAKRTKPL